MNLGLHEKRVLITGATGGIGSVLVREFLAEGAQVAAHFHRNEARAHELEKQGGKGRCQVFQANLSQEADVESLFEKIEKQMGPVDILVGNAGQWPEPFVGVVDMDLERWKQTLDTNLTSLFLCVRAFLRGVRKYQLREPSAVLIGSTAAHFGEAGHGDYAASKAGFVFGLLPSLKNEIVRLAPLGRINVVSPGWVRTDMSKKALGDSKVVQRVLQTIALRKVAKPEDIAALVLFLSSSVAAGHITGQSHLVAGGMEGRVLYTPEEIELP